MGLTCILVENEEKVREVFKTLLNTFFPNMQVVGEAGNISDAYTLITQKKPDVVFLDIEMPGGNGFELLEKFESVFFEIVFVSSYGHYAIKAIKSSALDYLLKPVMIDELKAIAKKIGEKVEQKEKALKYSLLQENLNTSGCPKKIIIHTKSKIETVDTGDILYLTADGNYTHIYLHHNPKSNIHIAKTLKEYEDILCEGETPFIRVHKANIINLTHIMHIENGEESRAVLTDGSKVAISRRKKQEVLDKLNSYNNAHTA